MNFYRITICNSTEIFTICSYKIQLFRSTIQCKLNFPYLSSLKYFLLKCKKIILIRFHFSCEHQSNLIHYSLDGNGILFIEFHGGVLELLFFLFGIKSNHIFCFFLFELICFLHSELNEIVIFLHFGLRNKFIFLFSNIFRVLHTECKKLFFVNLSLYYPIKETFIMDGIHRNQFLLIRAKINMKISFHWFFTGNESIYYLFLKVFWMNILKKDLRSVFVKFIFRLFFEKVLIKNFLGDFSNIYLIIVDFVFKDEKGIF